MAKFIIAALLVLFTVRAVAQQGGTRFHQLTTVDGLSQSTVQVIIQDSRGYMWFGTQDGLNKYDGHNFTVYKYSPADPHSISDNDIQALYVDSENNLWIGTQTRGLNLYDSGLDSFQRFRSISDEETTISGNAVRALLEDSYGIFWVGTAYGLNIMDRENGTFIRLTTNVNESGHLSNNQINVLYEDSSGVLWIGTDNGLNRFDRENETFDWFLHKSGTLTSSGHHNIRAIHEDQYGTLWIGTEDQDLHYFDRENQDFKAYKRLYNDDYQLFNSSVFHILEDSHGKLWTGTSNGGLESFDRENNIFKRYIYHSDDHHSINNNFITSLYESREQIIWVGTFGGGVNFIEVEQENFTHFKNEPTNDQSLSNNTVRSFFQDTQGYVWIGTDGGGLNRFDPQTGLFERFRHDPENNNSITNDAILSLHGTNEGLWLTSYGSGIDLFDTENHTVRNIRNDPADPKSLSSDYVFVVHETSDGKIWFGTNWGGISILDPETETFHRYIGNHDAPRNPETIGNNDIRAIFEDSYGDVWIGAYGEVLNRYNRKDDNFSFYKIDVDTEFFASVVQHIFEDSRRQLWMATRGGGLMRYNRDADILEPITTRDGLPNNMVHSIEEDGNGFLWISTNDGISRYDPVKNEFLNFGLQDGLQSREFSPKASMIDDNGYLYFGGINGFNRFHPDKVNSDSLVPPVVLTELLLFYKPVPVHESSVLKEHISHTNRLVLDHTNPVITLGYTVLNYSSKKANKFAYKLEGFDEEWNYVGDQRRATYTNLKPGEYTFRVIASTNTGIWDENGVSLTLIITPPFWQTTWFTILMILFITGCIILAYRLRFQAIEKNNKRLEQLVSERTAELKTANATKDRLFSIIAHDLNNVAVGFVGITDLLRHSVEKEDLDDAREYVGYLNQASDQFVTMLKNLLNWARAQTGRIQYCPKNINLSDLAAEIMDQEKMSALNKGIKLSARIDPELYTYADPDLLSVVLRNLLNNALKFTSRGGRVELLSCGEDNGMDNTIKLSIKDDGIGMDDETLQRIFQNGEQITTRGTSNEKGTGLGLSLCRDFIRINNGTLNVESQQGIGTTILLTLPASENECTVEATLSNDLHGTLA